MRRTHHIVKSQCNECYFLASEPHTLQVHFGKNHSTKKHCGLCDKEFINLEELEKHLAYCEVYVCSNSGCKEHRSFTPTNLNNITTKLN